MDENNNRNFFLAIALSILVLVAWQFLYAGPRVAEEQARRERFAQQTGQQAGTPGATPQPGVGAPAVTVSVVKPREEVLKEAPRIPIETPSLSGSLSLKGGRIDDLVLHGYQLTTERNSPEVVLFAPSGTSGAYYAEHGWSGGNGARLPDANTLWQVAAGAKLIPSTPVTLTWDNGAGLVFTRTISVDQDYMFTVEDAVENRGSASISLNAFALISRHGEPKVEGLYILHEGPIGVLGEAGLEEWTYSNLLDDGDQQFKAKTGWLGITDKYWAAVLVPPQGSDYTASFKRFAEPLVSYQTDYIQPSVAIAPGATTRVKSHLFAGAKRVGLIDNYQNALGIEKFELLIDWGWFYFITRPLFYLIDFIHKYVGNFGVTILIVTVFVKAAMFPIANRSFASMSKMKKLQPEVQKLQERFKDDKVRQQQEMMALYKKEKVNPLSGCLPVFIQIPVFFALYKVLYVALEMRHAPFFGWIQDLSAPDPTSLFNLFGLIPWQPPHLLMLGIWPLIMGVTMWLQMKLNPPPPDPVQARMFAWMPLIFTFMLGSFPVGLVIYWAWSNSLTIAQQWWIMSRHGVEVKLMDNLREDFGWILRLLGGGAASKKS